jgi:HAMP domain-containing protein
MSESEERQSRFVSLRVKLLVGFALLFIVFALIVALGLSGVFNWFRGFATDMALQRITEDLRITLEGAAKSIDADELVAWYERGKDLYGDDIALCGLPPEEGGIVCDELTQDPAYQAHLDWLDAVHQVEPRAWPYAFVKSDDPDKPYEVVWISDLWVRYDEESAVPFLYHYTPEEDPEVLIQGMSEITTYGPYGDEWGQWLSAYMPVSGGEGVAGIGIDFEATYVREVQQSVEEVVTVAFRVAIGALLGLIVIALVLVFIVSTSLTRPIIGLTAVAERVAEGDYDQNISALHSGRLRDEVSTLAQVFAMMVDKVRAREQRLKQQVAELRIEIDQAKREKHVSEITDTDYFRELQQKARKLRESGGSSEE